ncbi:hypothetical protein SDRG_14008, partial [Saprolegnia diclina VS20]
MRSCMQRLQQNQNRVVVLWRAVLDDRQTPYAPNRFIGNDMGWVVVHARGKNECVVQTIMTKLTPMASSLSVQPAVGTLTELVLQTSEANSRKFGVGLHNAIAARITAR